MHNSDVKDMKTTGKNILAHTSMKRQMKSLNVKPDEKDEKMNILIAFSEDQSSGILKIISDYAASQNLSNNICLPVNIVLTVKSKQNQLLVYQQSISESTILDFKFLHGASDSTMSSIDLGNEKEMLPLTSKFVELLVLLSSEP